LRVTRDELHAQIVEDRDLADRLIQKIVGRLSRMALELRQIDATLSRSADATAKSFVSRKTQLALPASSAAAH
jgi:uncharacterized protein YpiB (UPF0302 family)